MRWRNDPFKAAAAITTLIAVVIGFAIATSSSGPQLVDPSQVSAPPRMVYAERAAERQATKEILASTSLATIFSQSQLQDTTPITVRDPMIEAQIVVGSRPLHPKPKPKLAYPPGATTLAGTTTSLLEIPLPVPPGVTMPPGLSYVPPITNQPVVTEPLVTVPPVVTTDTLPVTVPTAPPTTEGPPDTDPTELPPVTELPTTTTSTLPTTTTSTTTATTTSTSCVIQIVLDTNGRDIEICLPL